MLAFARIAIAIWRLREVLTGLITTDRLRPCR
jgi:hypothetical protein